MSCQSNPRCAVCWGHLAPWNPYATRGTCFTYATCYKKQVEMAQEDWGRIEGDRKQKQKPKKKRKVEKNLVELGVNRY